MERSNFLLDPTQRIDARDALRILDGTGISLTEAARRAVAGKIALRRVTVAVAADEFLHTRLTGRRRATFDWYEEKLKHVIERFGSQPMDAVGRADLREWLGVVRVGRDPKPMGTTAKAATARAVRALWRWAMRQEPPMVGTDITTGMTFTTKSRGGAEPTVLTPEQAKAIMEGAGPHRDALALMLFAGVRPEEVAGDAKGLVWANVVREERIITVPPEASKTGRRRPMEGLPETIWCWLGKGEPTEKIAKASARRIVEVAAGLAGYGKGKKWPQDCLRHTFASHALALTANPGQVSLWLGHEGSVTMLHRHYRGLSSRSMAEAFFRLAPAELLAARSQFLRVLNYRPNEIG